jgi:hypothetical protein
VAEQDDGANMEPAVNVTIPAEQEVAPWTGVVIRSATHTSRQSFVRTHVAHLGVGQENEYLDKFNIWYIFYT